jgi:signal transduction histidine kinase
MNSRLTQLLDYAKSTAMGMARELCPVDAAQIAGRTVALFRYEAVRKKISLLFDTAQEQFRALGVEEGLNAILSNLLGNALEAAPENGTVRVSIRRRNGEVLLQVTDDGPGVPVEVRERIFEPFFTTKAKGTGLGLSIVARRVSEMGGSITCESPVRDGRGTRFTVTLRAAP